MVLTVLALTPSTGFAFWNMDQNPFGLRMDFNRVLFPHATIANDEHKQRKVWGSLRGELSDELAVFLVDIDSLGSVF